MNNRTKIAVVLGVVVIAAGLYLGNSKYNKGSIGGSIDTGLSTNNVDLTVGNITVRPSPIPKNTANVTVYAQTSNLGKAGTLAAPFDVTVEYTGVVGETEANPGWESNKITGTTSRNLPAGSSHTTSISVPVYNGYYLLQDRGATIKLRYVVCLDPENRIAETNESNNCKTSSWTSISR